ncbi:MAG TPA: KpsF/GutQ family sugar-phosphate isomerase [Chlorobaculum parvum]|uniref:KpsF/GutQ family sugar-phosphate isomerase n=1 Tax=Chlorobaculum parvum TaxID=274539 RepID=A0A7C5DGC5_9CHLB|nr:KpsF/GutQ family sugar-phosphate isomerase [Chlorobaculum parvum]
MSNRLDENFAKAVELMLKSKSKIIISGMGKSGIIGQKIAATLSSTGTTAVFMHPAEAAHGDLGVVCRGDTVICLSKSGMTEELNFIIPALRERDATIIAFTGNSRSYLGMNADVVLDVGVDQEACPYDLAPTTSTTAMLAMGDALAICVMKKKNFTDLEFALTHPKGSLGKQLTMKVSDVMATGESLPIVSEDATLSDLILEMTSKRYGVCGVVDSAGRLTGIFTDGDLRRLVQTGESFLDKKASDVMTPNPKTVSADLMAKECLELLETHRITQLLVCDTDKHPAGIVHIHDLVSLGL